MNAVVSMSPAGVGIFERDHMALIARHAAAESSRSFLEETSAELLRTIAEQLDIRSVFPRVSEIVKQVLPHDALGLVFHDRGGRSTLEASSTADLAGHAGCAGTDDEASSIVSDLRRMSSRPGNVAPEVDHLVAAGYRSVLTVRSRARNQMMRLGFLSRDAGAFS